MYDCADYASSRLVDTLVRLDGKAVRVVSVEGDIECTVETFPNGERSTIDIDELDLKSPPLGFVNGGGRAYYVARKPMRQDWRQGVRPNSVRSVNTGSRVSLHTLAKCIDGDFPTFAKASAMLGDWREVALSREFSISKRRGSIIINYKWYGSVGVIVGGKVSLTDGYQYLSKEVEGLL